MAIVCLYREVVVLIGRHHKESTTDLIGHLGLDDITAHGISVEGCRCALVAQGVHILRSASISQFERGDRRQAIVDRQAGFERAMRLHNLVLTIVVIPGDITIRLDVVIERPA